MAQLCDNDLVIKFLIAHVPFVCTVIIVVEVVPVVQVEHDDNNTRVPVHARVRVLTFDNTINVARRENSAAVTHLRGLKGRPQPYLSMNSFSCISRSFSLNAVPLRGRLIMNPASLPPSS